jgi:succinoglycan biosynthesis transport protein ExoP
VDNLQDNTKSNADSPNPNKKNLRGPVMRLNGDSDIHQEKSQPAQIVPGAQRRISVADATLIPAQFMSAPGAAQAIPSAGDIIKSMLRFKWTIIVVFILVAAPAVAAIWTLVVPKYQAQAQVRVRPMIPYLVFPTEESGKIPLYDAFVNTQVSIITGDGVLRRVLDQRDIQQTKWYINPPKTLMSRIRGTTPSHIDRLKDSLSARPVRDTEIINVSFTDAEAKEAQLITNTVLEQYMSYISVMTETTQTKIYDELVNQCNTLQGEIQVLETRVADSRRRLNTTSPEELISSKKLRLDETQARFIQVQQNIALLEWEKSRTVSADGNDVPADANDGNQKHAKYYEDEEWQKLDDNVRTIRYRIDTSLLTPNHPDYTQAQKDLKLAEDQLKRREEQLDKIFRDRLNNVTGSSMAIAKGLSYEEGLIYVENQLARSKREENLLKEDLDKQQKEFAALFDNAQELERLNNELSSKRELFSSVRQRRDQKRMEQNVPGSIEILTYARLPDEPYYDRRLAFSAMAIFLALGAGCGLAYRKANRSQTIYTPGDMPHPRQVPFLGYIPVDKNLRLPDRQAGSATIESVRVVRTALLSLLNGEQGTTVMVTSATEGTGKSTFTMLLSESLARSGKNVLLIDADFRKKTLTRQFDLDKKAGLIQSLNQGSAARHYIYKTEEIPGLSFMPAGTQSNNGTPFEETANGDFSLHIDKLRSKYNIILLDSPPVLPVADAAILSGQVDGTIIVERELVSRRIDVINALVRLNSAGGRFLGTVFIGSESQKSYG